jgi:cytochrome c oxidase subunit 6a
MFTTRAAKQLRSPILRQLGRRQLHGAGQTGFQGAADNAFNRERAAVKEHAAATSGTS